MCVGMARGMEQRAGQAGGLHKSIHRQTAVEGDVLEGMEQKQMEMWGENTCLLTSRGCSHLLVASPLLLPEGWCFFWKGEKAISKASSVVLNCEGGPAG